MPFTLIKGNFHAIGKRPDGDTLAFKAKNPVHWQKLTGPIPRFNKDQSTSQRFQAIDTLETHYSPGGQGGQIRQPNPLADDATDFVLEEAKVKKVIWGMKNGVRTEITSAIDKTPGYVLSNEVERFGRPVSFVFSGNTSRADGSSQFLDVKWLKKSINYKLIAAGLAYPSYYEAMCRFIDLRDAFTAEVIKAFNAKKGLWPVDKTGGLTVNGEAQLVNRDVILPKLFRRLTVYLRTNKNKVKGFKAWLKTRDDKILVLSTGLMGNLDEVVFEKGKRVGLTVEPEDLIFKP